MQTPFLDQLLDRINQRARTDIKPILGGLSWLFSGQILIAVIGFLSTVVLANFLDEASFGEYKYLLTLAGMVGVLSLTGLKEATVRAVAQGNEAELYRTIRLILRWSGGMILTASGIAGYYFYMGNEQIALAGLAMLLFVPMATAFSTFLPYLNGKQLYGSFATLRTLYLAAPPAATLGVVWFTTDVLLLFVSFVAAQGIGALLLFLCTIRRYPPNDQ
ncbi:MAG: oligosaccharide flippase family protein, partial [Patescibacteria group bacterium]